MYLFSFQTFLSFPFLVCGEMVSLMSRALASQIRRPKFLEFLTLLDSFDTQSSHAIQLLFAKCRFLKKHYEYI